MLRELDCSGISAIWSQCTKVVLKLVMSLHDNVSHVGCLYRGVMFFVSSLLCVTVKVNDKIN